MAYLNYRQVISKIWDATAGAIKTHLVDSAGTEVLGKVTASPTSNTLLGRTKETVDGIDELKALVGEVQASPTSNTLLDRLKALLTGIVLAAGSALIGKVGIDQATANANEVVIKSGTVTTVSTVTAVTSLTNALPAGTNLIGKVSEPATVETPFTATTGNIAAATHKIAPAAAFKLTEFELHLAAAPTGANPNLVIALDDGVAPAYDLVILTLDLVANAVTDLVIKPNKVCKSTDVITAAWTNTNNITWAIKFKHQLL